MATRSAQRSHAPVIDLDEDDGADATVVDTTVAASLDIPVIDLDEDAVPAAMDSATATTADVPVFDLDEAIVEAFSLDAQTDAETIALDEAETAAVTEAEAEADDDALSAAAEAIALDEVESNDDGSLWQPPAAVTNEDLHQAQQDERHANLMGQYMRSRGVI